MYIKEYHNILYCSQINVYTNHKNITLYTLLVPRVIGGKLFLKDYVINLTYVPGKTNVLADCFLRLHWMNGHLLAGKNEGKSKILSSKHQTICQNYLMKVTNGCNLICYCEKSLSEGR